MKDGDKVTWTWGQGTAAGVIVETFTQKVSRVIKGKKITRNASLDEPAYFIKQDDGGRVLKSASEINKA